MPVSMIASRETLFGAWMSSVTVVRPSTSAKVAVVRLYDGSPDGGVVADAHGAAGIAHDRVVADQ
jgi:hypothetical protein